MICSKKILNEHFSVFDPDGNAKIFFQNEGGKLKGKTIPVLLFLR